MSSFSVTYDDVDDKKYKYCMKRFSVGYRTQVTRFLLMDTDAFILKTAYNYSTCATASIFYENKRLFSISIKKISLG